MPKRMPTREEMRTWKERWDLVNEFQTEELRCRTPNERMRDLARLMLTVRECGWEKSLEEDDLAAREQWLKLYRAYGLRGGNAWHSEGGPEKKGK